MTETKDYQNVPNSEGFFGNYGGQFVPPQLQAVLDEVTQAYEAARNDPTQFPYLGVLLKDHQDAVELT